MGEQHEWPKILAKLQAALNNSKGASTGKSPNEVVYGFRLREATDLGSKQPISEDIPATRDAIRKDVADAIAFAVMKAKQLYDNRHRP